MWWYTFIYEIINQDIDGLAQDCSNSIAKHNGVTAVLR